MSSDSHGSPSSTMARMSGASRAAVSEPRAQHRSASEAPIAALVLGQGVVEVVGRRSRARTSRRRRARRRRPARAGSCSCAWSPPVRMRRSTSGWPAVYRCSAKCASSIAFGSACGRHQGARGVDDLGAPGVVEADVQGEARSHAGAVLRGADRALDVRGCLVQAADDLHPHALLDELVGVLPHGAVDEAEQPRDLVLGTAPVLGAEGVDAQRLRRRGRGRGARSGGWPRCPGHGPRAPAGRARGPSVGCRRR